MSTQINPDALSKDNRWYLKEIGDRLTPDARALLEGYSKIPADDIESHIYRYRDVAWNIFPFPCIGNFWFLSLGLSQHPHYLDLLTRLKSSDDRFLDIGTCFGQDLRKLVFDGVPKANVCGSDYFADYEKAGHGLFLDADTWQSKFIAADIFSDDNDLTKTRETWNVISANMFIHVFNLADSKRACKQMLKLLKPARDSWIMGVQVASIEPGEIPVGPPMAQENSGRTVYQHSKETFEDMWMEVAGELGLKLDVWAEYRLREKPSNPADRGRESFFSKETSRRLYFLIKLL